MEWGANGDILLRFTSKENFDLCVTVIHKIGRALEWFTLFAILFSPFWLPFFLVGDEE